MIFSIINRKINGYRFGDKARRSALIRCGHWCRPVIALRFVLAVGIRCEEGFFRASFVCRVFSAIRSTFFVIRGIFFGEIGFFLVRGSLVRSGIVSRGGIL